jgi:hypothetical protein
MHPKIDDQKKGHNSEKPIQEEVPWDAWLSERVYTGLGIAHCKTG